MSRCFALFVNLFTLISEEPHSILHYSMTTLVYKQMRINLICPFSALFSTRREGIKACPFLSAHTCKTR